MQKTQRCFLRNKQQEATRCFANFIVQENKRFHWPLVQQQIADHMQKFSSFGRKKKTDQNSTWNGYAPTSSIIAQKIKAIQIIGMLL